MAKIQAGQGYDKLKDDIAKNNIGNLYVFFGDEPYLKRHYINTIKKMLVDDNLESFNYSFIDGKSFSVSTFSEQVDSLPIMSKRKVICVCDYPVMSAPSAEASELAGILLNLPDCVCVVFDYDTLEYKQDKKNKACAAILEKGLAVNFKQCGGSELYKWIERRFTSLGKSISLKDCEYLAFYCGTSMYNLVLEIEKIAAYSKGKVIRQDDINAVAIKSLDAAIYELTDALAERNFVRALEKLRELFALGYESIVLASALFKQIQKLYSARLVIDYGINQSCLADIWNMKSAYPVQKLIRAAKEISLSSLRVAIQICGECDLEMKSYQGDRREMIEIMLLRIADALE